MAEKKKPKNIYGTEQQWEDIRYFQHAAGYTTLSKFVIDSALSNQTLVLNEVARQLGRLGMICNEVLVSDGDETQKLQGAEAEAALQRVIETCDRVIYELKRA